MLHNLFCIFMTQKHLSNSIMSKTRPSLFIIILTLCLVCMVSAQSGVIVVPDSKGMYESFFALNDSVMRREIGSFTFTGSIVGLSDEAAIREFEVVSQTNYTITLMLDDIKVHINAGPFVRAGRRLNYHGPYGYVHKIDGRNFWGYDGRVPNRQIYSVNIYFGQQQMQLPNAAYRDIFEPNLCVRRHLFSPVRCYPRVFLSEDGMRIYIYMLNSREPSLYEVCWIVSEGKYIGRVVDYAY